MRLTIAVLVMVGLPVVVAAQSRPMASSPPLGVPLPLSQIGLPLPPIGLPRLSMGFPPIESQTRVEKARPLREIGNRHRRFGRKPSAPAIVYIVPVYGFDHLPLAQAGTPGYFPDASSDQEERPLVGTLRLEVESPGAVLELYVDGHYVETPANFNGEVALEAGPHIIEIRAPGYETLQLDVNIAPDRLITYRGSLTPASVPPPPDPTVQSLPHVAPRTPTTFYFIPGCYAGNVPPKDAGLPATCDQTRVITITQ